MTMVEAWLVKLMQGYNHESYEQRAGYLAQVHMPGHVFQSLIWWALQSLPDEILVGIDIDAERPHRVEVEHYFSGDEVHNQLCLLYTSPSPRDQRGSRMPSSA